MIKEVIIMIGVPGSGKTTWINNYIRENYILPSEHVICSADHFFEKTGKYIFFGSGLPQAHAECMAKFKHALTQGIQFIFIDNTNIKEEHRDPYIMAANEAGYKVRSQVCIADPDTCFNRNIHGVSLSAILRMHSTLKAQNLVN